MTTSVHTKQRETYLKETITFSTVGSCIHLYFTIQPGKDLTNRCALEGLGNDVGDRPLK